MSAIAPAAPPMMATIASAIPAAAGRSGFGGAAITFNATLGTIGHAVPKGGYQTVSVQAKIKGAPSSVSASGIHAVVFGDCLVTLGADTEAGAYSPTAVITNYRLSGQKNQATRIMLSMASQGVPAYATS